MRSFRIAAMAAVLLAAGSLAGQQSSKKPQPQTEPTPLQEKAGKPAAQPAQPSPKPEENKPAPADESKGKDKDLHFDVAEVAPIVTRHQVTVNGRVLRYTATAGRLPIKREDGKIEAEMFFVAYTLEGQEASRRPLTFAFNGGPGSASVWLHMGALGPKRVVLTNEGFMPPGPYRMEDNPSTLLDRSDLVLVDAIGTGFSRAADAETSKKFWGVKGDIEAYGEFIRLFLTRYERWTSPLFMLGESYGTTRAAGVAGYLADKGITFSGITLLSTVLNFQTVENTRTNDQAYIFLIPTYTMAAAYHHKLAPDLAQDLSKARQEAEHWASNEYAQALDKGDALTAQERETALEQMARYTGLSKSFLDQADMRVDVQKFTHNLLLDQKLRVGRLDTRFTGPDPEGLLDTRFYDPTSSAIVPPYTTVFNQYVRNELGYKSDMPYYVFAGEAGFRKWEWGNAIEGFPDTASALRAAMAKDPYLKVLVMEGYYDLATPYYAATYTMQHLGLPPALRKNISFATYDCGHMVYLKPDMLAKMKRDQAAFMDQALAGTRAQ